MTFFRAIDYQHQHTFHQAYHSGPTAHMVQSDEDGNHQTADGRAQDINCNANKNPLKIFNNYDGFPQATSTEDVSISSFGSATTKSIIEKNGDEDKDGAATTLIVKTREGLIEQLEIPRSAAVIIAALKEEVVTLKQELESMKSTRRSIQPFQDDTLGGKSPFTNTQAARSAQPIGDCTENTAKATNSTPSMAFPKKKRMNRNQEKPAGEKTGRWSSEEHRLFLKGMKLHGRRWTKVATIVKTRTDLQVRTHAQKYFNKLSKSSRANRGVELDDATIDRLVELDLQSSPPKSNTKKGRYANKRKMSAASAGSASSVSDGKIDTSIGSCPKKEGKRHASEASNASGSHTSHPLSPSDHHHQGSNNLSVPPVNLSMMRPISMVNHTTCTSFLDIDECDHSLNVASESRHEVSCVSPSSYCSLVDSVDTHSRNSTSIIIPTVVTTNFEPISPHLHISGEGIDSETLDLLNEL